MIKYLGIFLIVIASSCSQQKSSQASITPFGDFLKQYHEERQTFYPLESTYAGETKLNHLLPIDISQKFIHDLRSMYSRSSINHPRPPALSSEPYFHLIIISLP